jgi:hypothetical protein
VFVVRTLWNTHTHSVGGMTSIRMLKQAVVFMPLLIYSLYKCWSCGLLASAPCSFVGGY